MFLRLRPAHEHTTRVRSRRLLIVLLGIAHLAILGFAPVRDAAPAPSPHQHHLAAETAAGCQTYHADHCVLCRVLTGEAVDGGPVAGAPLAAPPAPEAFFAGADAARDRPPHSPTCARAPPAA